MNHAILCTCAVAICIWEAISLWRFHAQCRRAEQRFDRDVDAIDAATRSELRKRLEH